MKILNLFFIMLIEASVFLTCAQGTDNGFEVVKLSSGRVFFKDINCEKYKGGPQDRNGRQLNLYGIKYEKQVDQLMILEKSIFSMEERKKTQKQGRRPVLAHVIVDAVSGNIVCVSFTFRNIDKSFKIDTEKLARYREEIKKNIKFESITFERGGNVASGYFRQSMRIFIDLDDK